MSISTAADVTAHTKWEHGRVARLLDDAQSRAEKARDLLLPVYDETDFALMDADERDALGDVVNALHDAIEAFKENARLRRGMADRADWTAADWSSYELVAANID